MLPRVHAHLDAPDAAVRGMFFDFSSAFNTIQPDLREKLGRMRASWGPVSWIMDLTSRPQYVQFRNCVSSIFVCVCLSVCVAVTLKFPLLGE